MKQGKVMNKSEEKWNGLRIRMRRYMLLFVSLFLYLLAGCQQVPDEVLERMESYGRGEQIEKTEGGYCTIEELRNTRIEDIDHIPDNLTLPEQVDFSGIESIGMLVLKRYEQYAGNREKIARMLGVSNPEWTFVEAESNSNWYEYEDDTCHTYLAVDENGELSYLYGEEYDNLSDEQWPPTIERIHLNREACPQMVCNLESGQVQLSDVLARTQEWVDRCETLQDEFDYELKTVYVKEKPDQNHRIAMLFQRMYKGVGLNYTALGSGG